MDNCIRKCMDNLNTECQRCQHLTRKHVQHICNCQSGRHRKNIRVQSAEEPSRMKLVSHFIKQMM